MPSISIATLKNPLAGRVSPGDAGKAILRLNALSEATTISNEAELLGREVFMTHPACRGEKGKIAKVVTAKRLREPLVTQGHKDVFYTIETSARFITGVMWQDFLQLPRQ